MGTVLDLNSPVRAIPTDTGQEPETGVALCLSGGGFRAMLFHLGVIWRLIYNSPRQRMRRYYRAKHRQNEP